MQPRKHLQRRQMLGKKFRRQYSIGRYIVDFFCVECDIGVELDGAPHFRELRAEYEAEHTAFLQGLGTAPRRQCRTFSRSGFRCCATAVKTSRC
ncbi:MAG: hypothetical protein DMG13_26145 [Acidobacteria bacterium]|nr:MAG: hypothetical protein DMG13_26145 [Acidobacteriota bacterium]